MQLARFLNNVFKKDGFILEDANLKNYIIGTPESDKPIKVKLLDKFDLIDYEFVNKGSDFDLVSNIESCSFLAVVNNFFTIELNN